MKDTKPRVSVITLGCPKNLVDSEVVMEQLRQSRFELTDVSKAEVAVINTCGFIDAAKVESIETILEAVQLKKEGKLKKVVVMGCLSERYKNDLQREIPDVDVYIGANKMDQVVRELGANLRYDLLGERYLTTPRHFAYVKISEGCDNPCSFCAIPLMRGKHVSKPLEEVVREARSLASRGVKELILIAQDSTAYGLDRYGERRRIRGKRMIVPLLQELGQIDGIEWIRLMYAYPAKFPLELLEEFEQNPKLCRYIDLPIQHISNPVLKSMRRGISSRATRELIETIRSAVPGIALRSTLIVGYPNETDREFQELLEFVREGHFDRLGVFTYSQEEDTTAYRLGDPVPHEIKEERKQIIMEAQREISWRKNSDRIGQTIRMVVDRYEHSAAIGRTEQDAPEIDNEVVVDPGTELKEGNYYQVTIVDVEEYDLYAIPADAGGWTL